MKQETQKQSIFRAALVLITAAVLLAADQITKYFVLLYLKPVGSVPVIHGLLEFSYVENTGAAFGLFKNHIWFVVAVTVIAYAVIVVLLFRYRHHTFFSYATSALLLAGAFGNLLDRMYYGYVVDFIHVMFFDYIFNVADCCITVGAVFFVVHYLFLTGREKKDGKQPLEQSSGTETHE